MKCTCRDLRRFAKLRPLSPSETAARRERALGMKTGVGEAGGRRFENGCTVHGPACAARERALAQAANLLRRSTRRGSSLLAGSVVVLRLAAATCFVDEHDSCAVTSAQLASAKWDRRSSCGLASPQIRLRRAALASVPPPRPHPPRERARFQDFWGFFRGDERGMRWDQKAEDGCGKTVVMSRMRARRLSELFSSFLIPIKKR